MLILHYSYQIQNEGIIHFLFGIFLYISVDRFLSFFALCHPALLGPSYLPICWVTLGGMTGHHGHPSPPSAVLSHPSSNQLQGSRWIYWLSLTGLQGEYLYRCMRVSKQIFFKLNNYVDEISARFFCVFPHTPPYNPKLEGLRENYFIFSYCWSIESMLKTANALKSLKDI